MARKVVISALNQYRFVPMNQALPAIYNNLPFNKTLFQLTRKYWQINTRYEQKVQNNDPMRIQLWSGFRTSSSPSVAKVLLHLYTCKGDEVGTPLEIPRYSAVPLFQDDDDDNVYVNGIAVHDYWSTIDAGDYFLVLEVPYDSDGDFVSDGVDYFISEPILVKAKHPKTVLIDISNSINRDSIMFQQTFSKFSFRVEAAVVQPTPQVDRVVFKDQGSNSAQLSATVFNTWKLTIGFTNPVPYWVIEKMNHYFGCNNIYIDGIGYSQIDGSLIAFDSPDINYPFYQGTIELGEKNNTQNFQFKYGGILMLTDAKTYPYAITGTKVGFDEVNMAYYRGGDISTVDRIGSDANLDAWIAARNADLLSIGLETTISLVGDNIFCFPVDTELFNYANIDVLRGRLGVTVTLVSPETSALTLTLGGLVDGTQIVLTDPTFMPQGLLSVGAVQSTFTYPTFDPSASGTYNYEIFHDKQNLNYIGIDGQKVSAFTDFSVADNMPPKLATFGIQNSTKLLSFDLWNTFAFVRNYLQTVSIINNSNLTNFANLYFPPVIIGGTPQPGWMKLSTIFLFGNSLPQARLDGIYNSVGTASSYVQWLVYNGHIRTDHQVPAAVPSIASAPARLLLGPTGTGGTYNWSILSTP